MSTPRRSCRSTCPTSTAGGGSPVLVRSSRTSGECEAHCGFWCPSRGRRPRAMRQWRQTDGLAEVCPPPSSPPACVATPSNRRSCRGSRMPRGSTEQASTTSRWRSSSGCSVVGSGPTGCPSGRGSGSRCPSTFAPARTNGCRRQTATPTCFSTAGWEPVATGLACSPACRPNFRRSGSRGKGCACWRCWGS